VEALAGLEHKGFSDDHVWMVKFSSKLDELSSQMLDQRAPPR
jgi:hypothetical protein